MLLLFSHPVVSNSLQPHGLQHFRPACPSLFPGVCPNSRSLYWWCRPAILSSDALVSFYPQPFPASGTFPLSQLFISDDQNTGVSVSASVLPVSIQGWVPFRSTGLISLLSKWLSEVFSSATVQRHCKIRINLSFGIIKRQNFKSLGNRREVWIAKFVFWIAKWRLNETAYKRVDCIDQCLKLKKKKRKK